MFICLLYYYTYIRLGKEKLALLIYYYHPIGRTCRHIKLKLILCDGQRRLSRCLEIAEFCDRNGNPAFLRLLMAEALRPFIRREIWLGFRVCQTFYGLRHYCACTSVYYARTVVQINDRIHPDIGYICVYVCALYIGVCVCVLYIGVCVCVLYM